LEIIVLGSGTSQGIPIIGCNCAACVSVDPRDKRLRSSIFVQTKKIKIQIDVGPDFRQQYLCNNISSLDYVLITHEHNDHVIGMDELRALNYTQRKSIPILAEERVLQEIKTRFHYAFSEVKYPGVPQIELLTIPRSRFVLEDIQITPLRITHGNLPILGFRLNNFAYVTDASHIDDSEIDKIKGIDILIINALRIEKHYSHFNLKEALKCIKKISPKKAYLTHISHAMGPTAKWEDQLPENVFPLEDKMRINL